MKYCISDSARIAAQIRLQIGPCYPASCWCLIGAYLPMMSSMYFGTLFSPHMFASFQTEEKHEQFNSKPKGGKLQCSMIKSRLHQGTQGLKLPQGMTCHYLSQSSRRCLQPTNGDVFHYHPSSGHVSHGQLTYGVWSSNNGNTLGILLICM
jgi:hypothetical protein